MGEKKKTADSDIELQDDEFESAEEVDAKVGDAEVDAVEPTQGDLVVELELAKAQIAKLQDGYLRAKAEEDNVRRRSEKEVANSRKFAIEGFAKELLNVYDSLKLACNSEVAEDASEAVKNVHEGVQITLKQLNAVFNRFSLAEISPQAGDKLDPSLHQAMSLIESDEIESGSIINVMQSGFQLHDRLLRPAMVVVAK